MCHHLPGVFSKRQSIPEPTYIKYEYWTTFFGVIFCMERKKCQLVALSPQVQGEVECELTKRSLNLHSWNGGDEIVPLTIKEAMEWAKKKSVC